MRTILCLDISLTTGWAHGAPADNLPSGGVWPLGTMKDRTGRQQFGYLANKLHDLVEQAAFAHGVSQVVFETPISKAQTTDRLLKYLAGSVEMACQRNGIGCYEISAPTVRLELIGQGTFPKPLHGQGKTVWRERKVKGLKEKQRLQVTIGDPKEEVGIYLTRAGIPFLDDNHADAIMLWLYASRMARGQIKPKPRK